jgi:hypothetical protein
LPDDDRRWTPTSGYRRLGPRLDPWLMSASQGRIIARL